MNITIKTVESYVNYEDVGSHAKQVIYKMCARARLTFVPNKLSSRCIKTSASTSSLDFTCMIRQNWTFNHLKSIS